MRRKAGFMIFDDPRVPNAAGEVFTQFSSAADAFSENFADGLEIGAAFAVMIDDELIVDIRGGYTDRTEKTPWMENTLVEIHSSGKGVVALLVACEVAEGRLDYDAPVADYWPQFAQNGKAQITVAQALSHQAGLCGFPEEVDQQIWIDWDAVITRLEGDGAALAARISQRLSPPDLWFLRRRTHTPRVGEKRRSAFASAK